MRAARRLFATLTGAALLGACATSQPEMPVVDYVDIDRFMGDWYVIANIPTFLEKGAHNAVETYTRNADGTIATRFTYRKGSFDGKRKEHFPKGFISDKKTNAIWGMRFVWPIKADYRIVYLEDDYSDHRYRPAETRLPLDHGTRATDIRCRLCSGWSSSPRRSAMPRPPSSACRNVGSDVKVAVIGTGIAGNVAAYHLRGEHDSHRVRGRAVHWRSQQHD